MKPKAVILPLLFLIFLNSISAQTWEKYKAEDLALMAYFPATPERTVEKVNTDVGQLDMHMIMYVPNAGDDNVVYAVIRSDYPKENFENADDEYNKSVLDGAVQGGVSNVQGTLVFENTVEYNGFPGRSVKIQFQDGFIYTNIYLLDNAMFFAQVICEASNDENQSIQRFLDSFEILRVKE